MKVIKRFVASLLILSFLMTTVIPVALASGMPWMPQPGAMVMVGPAYVPVMIKGLKVHPENPLLFDFILDTGKSGLKIDGPEFKAESQKLIKYFLASLTIKEDDLWVNLSPYEKDRMITEELGKTELGRDMLAQDYILKQLTASMIYPEKELGKAFWDRVYAKAQEQFGSADVPVDTFNKVWIVADKAKVLEHDNAAYVVGSHLKVMLEEDYVALDKQTAISQKQIDSDDNKAHTLASQIVREVIVPEIEKEVNQGQNFAPLRQMFFSMILASWYKQALKEALLNQVYTNKAKTGGVLSDDPAAKEKIYDQYLQAYKKGVFNYIKEDVDASHQQTTPRKYFSGGEDFAMLKKGPEVTRDLAQGKGVFSGDTAAARVRIDKAQNPDAATNAPVQGNQLQLIHPARGIRKVLLVDDVAFHHQPIRAALEADSYGVTVREDGKAALDFFEAGDINDVVDVVVTDKDMPHMTGDDFIRQLRARGFRGPIVLITNAPGDLVDAGLAGVKKGTDGVFYYVFNDRGIGEFGENTILMKKSTYGEVGREPAVKVTEIIRKLAQGEIVGRDQVAPDGRYSADADFLNRQIDAVLAGGDIHDINQWAIQKPGIFDQDMVDRILTHLGNAGLEQKIRLNAISIIGTFFHHGVPVMFDSENVVRFIRAVQGMNTYQTKTKGLLNLPFDSVSVLGTALKKKISLLDVQELRDAVLTILLSFRNAMAMDMDVEIEDSSLRGDLRSHLRYSKMFIDDIESIAIGYIGSGVVLKKTYTDFDAFSVVVEKHIDVHLSAFGEERENYSIAMDSLRRMFENDTDFFYKLIRALASGKGQDLSLNGVEEVYVKGFDVKYPGLTGRFPSEASPALGAIVNSLLQSEAGDSDKAMSLRNVNGGIDLNAKNMGLDVAKDGKGIEMKLDPAMVVDFQRGDFSGVVPVILQIIPIQNPLPVSVQ